MRASLERVSFKKKKKKKKNAFSHLFMFINKTANFFQYFVDTSDFVRRNDMLFGLRYRQIDQNVPKKNREKRHY